MRVASRQSVYNRPPPGPPSPDIRSTVLEALTLHRPVSVPVHTRESGSAGQYGLPAMRILPLLYTRTVVRPSLLLSPHRQL